eukprot:TRINITY_DN10624_c0_g1_i1.p2 TRINITY_DN10624_c0_g1~~TRINITY_DN10624_c0_g1_i1.p2  ORF type:complete len:121 (+),score=9.05 TRINITY_DN10624_c0_g1_i1:903-1265(+)
MIACLQATGVLLNGLLRLQWLAKQAAARKEVERAKSSQPGDVEHDPLWYRDRGRNFFNKGDFQSAINAFTAGCTGNDYLASPSPVSLSSNPTSSMCMCSDVRSSKPRPILSSCCHSSQAR